MNKKYKNEYLFVLGNGASIASANPECKNSLEIKPSIENFIPILEKLDEREKRSPFELSDLMDESHLQAMKRLIEKVFEISRKRGERNLVKLLAILEEENAKNWDQQNALRLQDRSYRSEPIWNDINTLENAIYHFVAAYYTNIEKKYFEKLWPLVQKDHSPVISLNWDINFETVIHEKHPTIPMANYYGECVFNLLPSDQKKDPYNPLVNILKPHGSFNWLIPTGIEATYGDLKKESDQIWPGSHLRVVDNLPANFNSEYQCFLIPPVPDKAAVNEYSELFWKIKGTIWDDISTKIKEYAINSRNLVIIGYSFPLEDEHIRNLFENNRFESVWLLDPSKETFKRIDKEKYFARASRRHYHGGFKDIFKLK